jgi:hypothetical protein
MGFAVKSNELPFGEQLARMNENAAEKISGEAGEKAFLHVRFFTARIGKVIRILPTPKTSNIIIRTSFASYVSDDA